MFQASRHTILLALSFAFLSTTGSCTKDSSPQAGAELVLRNGSVYTMDAVRSWAEAIAVRDEKITYVGTNAGVEEHIGPRTKVVDLKGRMLLPAFQDCHIHPPAAGLNYLTLPLYDLRTKEKYLKAVADYAAEHPDAPWIRGEGWQMDAFAPSGIPHLQYLDDILPDRPVYLRSRDGHSAWVNSKALKISGITKDTPDPVGGRIERDPVTGEPIGVLQEDSAMELVLKHMPPIPLEEKQRGLQYALKVLNGYGITSFQDAIVKLEGNDAYVSLDTYRTLDEKGGLTARVVAALFWDDDQGEEQIPRLIEARKKYTHGRLRATSVKIWHDGVIEAQTAALLEPYTDKPGETGIAHIEPGDLNRIVTRLDGEGFQVHFHSIGDASVRQALDSVEAAQRANGRRDARHHISHAQLINPADIPRFRQLGVAANFQPFWAMADRYITELTIPRLGPERSRWIYPIRSLFKSGAVVAFGSDWYVSTPNPLEEIEVAVTRMGPDTVTGKPFIPQERVDLHDALAAFTINAAYVNFQEESTGSIETGKLADLIVLDRNLFEVEPDEISETQVLLTLLDGVAVHGDLSQL
ncbi:MAG: amidohydrolase [Acidobacteriota bacterium]